MTHHQEKKLNVLVTLFSVDKIVKQANIPAEAFEHILNDIDGNTAEQALKEWSNKI